MANRPGHFSFGQIHEAIAATRPDEPCLVFRDLRLSWQDVTDRTRRLANFLHSQGLGCHTDRAALEGHQSGQDHLGIYLHNGNEYLETMLGAFKARVAPLNVNYRYVAEELRYVLNDARAAGVVVHSRFTPTLAQVVAEIPTIRIIVQVPDDSHHELLPGAVWYNDALAAGSLAPVPVSPSGDDLYILYTGGTTGMPKGVLWQNGDAVSECFGGSASAQTLADYANAAGGNLRALLAPPFMHGASHWMSFRTWLAGGTVFIQDRPERLDPADIWDLVQREKINFLLIVGDAFARPLLDELDRNSYDLSSLNVLLSGGASLSVQLKQAFLRQLPTVMIVDGLGSSEAGGQASHVSAGRAASTGSFTLNAGNEVLSGALDRVLVRGEQDLGWLAKRGRLALGYLGDEAKTKCTYPEIDGVRFAVPGDRAKLRADGLVELRGRDSVTINSGGEKIFAEEVEAAVKAHPLVYDCVVAGRPSQRWGSEVVAIVKAQDGMCISEDELLTEAALHIARYKLPKAIKFVNHIQRSPSGKADYRWATTMAIRTHQKLPTT